MLPSIIADTPLDSTVNELLHGKVQILSWDENPVDPSVIKAIYTFGHPRLDGQMMDRFPNLRIISNYGVGVDHIQIPDATVRGIPVGNTPDILNGATADMAFALLLAAARKVAEGDRYARSPQFTRYEPSYMLGREVHGATIGIVGLGRIGFEIARRSQGFNMRVLYHNRRPAPERADRVSAEYVSLERLLAASDYVVLVCPLTKETTGLISSRELSMMKPTAMLINIARGPVVDTAALTAALQNRQIYAAALDVTDPEPLPRDHPLLKLDNVTITPHLGSATEQTRHHMAEMSVENLLLGLAGKPLINQVNRR